MSNYMEFINDNGNVIVNDSFKNIWLIQKTIINSQGDGANNDTYCFCSSGYSGIRNTTGNSNYPYWYFVLVPIRENVITFVSCDVPDVLIHMHDIYTYEKRLSAKRIEFFIPNGKTVNDLLNKVTIYEFSYTVGSVDKGLGLQIFNSNSDKLFDSNFKYLNIIKSIVDRNKIDGTSYDVGKIAIHYGSYRYTLGSTGNNEVYHCIRINANKTLSWVKVTLYGGQNNNNIWGVGFVNERDIDHGYSSNEVLLYSPLLIADVTNY